MTEPVAPINRFCESCHAECQRPACVARRDAAGGCRCDSGYGICMYSQDGTCLAFGGKPVSDGK